MRESKGLSRFVDVPGWGRVANRELHWGATGAAGCGRRVATLEEAEGAFGHKILYYYDYLDILLYVVYYSSVKR